MKSSLYTLCYAAILGIVCAGILSAVGQVTNPYQKANAEADRYRNILAVLQVPFAADATPKDLVDIYNANVREDERGELTLYAYVSADDTNTVRAVAVPFDGKGLWGPIKGFLALEPDMRTIIGVTFHEQEETPGLGGEIAAQWFTDQFKGKTLVDATGQPGISIVPSGTSTASNEVDTITGATMTCDKVELMLNNVIKKIVQEQTQDGR